MLISNSLALTYTLDGAQNIRRSPSPIQPVNIPRLLEKDMPRWGSNVPNLEEWEALKHQAEDKSNSNSRILPLRDLNLNVVSQEGHLEDGSAKQKSETSSDQVSLRNISLRNINLRKRR
ncbi:Nin one binding (NOB1) Zn-ribbon-like protein [Arachis hypogaea]|nr:Nin one binding (NOB1) Zn-ribbon-like protein [Arachis hypogaea]